jgi:murein DD-endopeptidase MepM/ murein hydrolase activator NlpD
MKPPRLTHIDPDWKAVATDLASVSVRPLPDASADGAQAIADLNRATAELFPNIVASPVPVLLPFDTAAFLNDRAAGIANKRVDDYLSGFHLSPFFLPGPAGYDALFTAQASDMPELGISFSGRIEVFVSGFALLYDVDEPVGMVERPVKGFDADFFGIRHLLLENYARNTFERYGVPYVVSILCFDGGSRYRMISCRDAGKVAERFLKALHVAGGAPPAPPPAQASAPRTIERPADQSPDFTFRPPGDIIAGTGFKGKGGRADTTVYSDMRFPLLSAPAYANSQSFMNLGDCDSTGRVSMGMVGSVPSYRCRLGGQILLKDESAPGNYAYPWRDNFCEHRYFDVGECPGGFGHQGQDIRPSSCKQRFVGGGCEPYQHDVVAVRDGMVLRSAGQMPVYLFVNAPDEHIRFRYLHMFPRQLDQDGVLSGRILKQGEELGKVGSFFQHERATTYHLHFDMQVPTKYGWVFVNPYMTLVAAYERLIGGRGTEIEEEPRIAAASATTPPPASDIAPPETASDTAPPGAAPIAPTGIAPLGLRLRLPPSRPLRFAIRSEGEDQIESHHGPADQVPPDAAKGVASPRLGHGAHAPGNGASAEHEGAVRPVGGGVSRARARAGRFRRDLYAGHARPKAGHHRL